MKHLLITLIALALLASCTANTDDFDEFMGVEFGTPEDDAIAYISSKYLAKFESAEAPHYYKINMSSYEGYDVKIAAIGFEDGVFGFIIMDLKAENMDEAKQISSQLNEIYHKKLGEPYLIHENGKVWYFPYKTTAKILSINADSLLDARVRINAGVMPEQFYKKFKKEIEAEKNKNLQN